MDRSIILGYQGMRALQERIDTISNNVANLNTTGFKARETTFGELLYQQMPSQQPGGEVANANGRITPEQIRAQGGVVTTATPLRLSQGSPLQTGIETDLMIEGEGFFRVSRDANQNGIQDDPVYYTRLGRFTRSPQPDGYDYLVTPTGEYLLDEFDNPVAVSAGNGFRVEADGTLIQILPDGTQDPNYERIAVYRIPNPFQLANMGNGLLAYPANPNLQNGQGPILLNDNPDRFAIRQGMLEDSNVDLIKEMTALMEAERHLQLTSRSLQISDQFLQLANELVRR